LRFLWNEGEQRAQREKMRDMSMDSDGSRETVMNSIAAAKRVKVNRVLVTVDGQIRIIVDDEAVREEDEEQNATSIGSGNDTDGFQQATGRHITVVEESEQNSDHDPNHPPLKPFREWPSILCVRACQLQKEFAIGQDNILFNGLRVRMGVHYGTQITAAWDDAVKSVDYYGHDVNVASRVESIAMGGQIIVTPHIVRHVDFCSFNFPVILTPLGPSELKGIPGKTDLVQILPARIASRSFEVNSAAMAAVENARAVSDSVNNLHDLSGSSFRRSPLAPPPLSTRSNFNKASEPEVAKGGGTKEMSPGASAERSTQSQRFPPAVASASVTDEMEEFSAI